MCTTSRQSFGSPHDVGESSALCFIDPDAPLSGGIVGVTASQNATSCGGGPGSFCRRARGRQRLLTRVLTGLWDGPVTRARRRARELQRMATEGVSSAGGAPWRHAPR